MIIVITSDADAMMARSVLGCAEGLVLLSGVVPTATNYNTVLCKRRGKRRE